MGAINVAIIGVGNCASSLIQGIYKYSEVDPDHNIPGIMNTIMSDYHIGDIKIVAAFDIDKKKVGKDLSKAIDMNNNALKFHQVPNTGVKDLKVTRVYADQKLQMIDMIYLKAVS